MRVLYRVKDLVKIGNKDWVVYESRYRLRYGKLPEDKTKVINHFEELWELAKKDNRCLCNCQSIITKKRFVKVIGALSEPIYIYENKFPNVFFKKEYTLLNSEPTFETLIKELKASELIAYCNDRSRIIATKNDKENTITP